MLCAPAATILTLALSALPKPPQQVVFPAEKLGKVVFDHREHLALRITCKTCHGARPVGKIGFTTQEAHATCRGCHQELQRGPIGCAECHQRPAGAPPIPDLPGSAEPSGPKPEARKVIEPLPADERDRSRLEPPPPPPAPAPEAAQVAEPAAAPADAGPGVPGTAAAATAPTATPPAPVPGTAAAATARVPGTPAPGTPAPPAADASAAAAAALPRPPPPRAEDAGARFDASVALGVAAVDELGGSSGVGPYLHVQLRRARWAILHTQQWTGGRGHGHVLALLGVGEALALTPRWSGLLAGAVGLDMDFATVRAFPAVGLVSSATREVKSGLVRAFTVSLGTVLDPRVATDAVTSGDRFVVTFAVAAVIDGTARRAP